MPAQSPQQPVHFFGRLFGLFLEVDLVPAGAQGRCWRKFQPLDRARLLIAQIDNFFVEDTQNAILAPENFLDAFVMPRFDDDPRDGSVDYAGRSAGLGD